MMRVTDTDADLYPAYIVSHEAWYWPAAKLPKDGRQLSIQFAAKGGGVKWELKVEEYATIGVQLCVFDDAWQAFTDWPEFFPRLAQLGERATLEQVVELCNELGLKDITERRSPHPARVGS